MCQVINPKDYQPIQRSVLQVVSYQKSLLTFATSSLCAINLNVNSTSQQIQTLTVESRWVILQSSLFERPSLTRILSKRERANTTVPTPGHYLHLPTCAFYSTRTMFSYLSLYRFIGIHHFNLATDQPPSVGVSIRGEDNNLWFLPAPPLDHAPPPKLEASNKATEKAEISSNVPLDLA